MSKTNTIKKKAKKFRIGLKQIIIEVLSGLLTTFVLTWLANAGYLPENVALAVNILLVLGNILLIKSMWTWGFFYTIGWLIGSFIFLRLGMLSGTWDIILYIVLPVAALTARFFFAVKKRLAA